MYSFRPSRSEDTAAVHAIVESVLREYGLEFDASNTDTDLADIPANYGERGGAFQVIESPEGAIVGCGGLFRITADIVELRKMYLLPEARGRGLGKKLLTQLLAEARRLGYKRIILETNSRLQEAIVLYQSFGFAPVTRQHLAKRCDQAWELTLNSQPSPGREIF
jgi:putative acetyltransferase